MIFSAKSLVKMMIELDSSSSIHSTPVSASQAGDWALVRFGLDFLIICYLVLQSTAAPDFLTTVTTGLDTPDTTPTV